MADLTEHLVLSTIDCIEELHLLELDEAWMSEILCNEFSNFEEHPGSMSDIFPEGFGDSLSKFLEVCKKWARRCESTGDQDDSLDSSSEDDDNLWEILIKNNIDVKSILCLLFMFCSRSTKTTTGLEEKQMGLTCARIYITLVRIPGSTAYSIYHPNLLKAVISCLKFPKDKGSGKKRTQNSSSKSDMLSPRSKRGNRRNRVEEFGDENDEFPGSDSQEVELTIREYETLYFDFAKLLKALILLLENFSVKDEDTMDQIIKKLVECTACDNQHSDFSFSHSVSDIMGMSRRNGICYVVSTLAYRALLCITQPLQGNPSESYLNILKNLCGHLLCAGAKSQTNAVIPHRYVVLRDSAVGFICHYLNERLEYSVPCTKILVQQLCVRVSDKSDFRCKVAQAIIAILRHFPAPAFAEMNEWFERLMYQNRISDRMIALEVASFLINESPREVTEDLLPELHPYVTFVPLAKAIIHRCQDKAPSVRTKALSTLASNLEKIFSILKGNVQDQENDTSSSVSTLSSESDLEFSLMLARQRQNPSIQDGQNQANQDGESSRQLSESTYSILNELYTSLILRFSDIKVHARKAALLVVEALICFDRTYLKKEILDLFWDAAHDRNVSVRKACLGSITSVLQAHPEDSKAQCTWMKCVLPLVLDVEKSVQGKCLEVIESELLANISGCDARRRCAWKILNNIATSRENMQRLLCKAFTYLKAEGKLRPNLRTLVEQEIATENNAAAWLLLSILSRNIEIKQTSVIVNYWENYNHDALDWLTLSNVLEVIGNCSKSIPPQQLGVIRDALECKIRSYEYPMEIISTAVETLFVICKTQSSKDDSYQRVVQAFSSEVMKATEAFLSKLVVEENWCPYSLQLACKHLHTFGELALMCPLSVPKKARLVIQSIVTASSGDASGSNGTSRRGSQSRGSSQQSQFSKLSKGKKWPPEVQAVALVALGKLCLQNEDLAKNSIQVLGCLLKSSSNPMIRTNIVLVLCDLCVRYTAAVDLYIPTISECLKDVNPQVRQQTLTLLSLLLQEDYIKLKDSLFYRLLSTVIDESENVASLAEYCFENVILKKNKSAFLQHFVECLFFFNAFFDATNRNKFSHVDKDTELFSLPGNRNQEKRMKIYKFMLKRAPIGDRFMLTTKLWNEVMASFSENMFPWNDASGAVFKDCVAILCCDEIKIRIMHPSACGDEDDDHELAAEAAHVEKTINRELLMPTILKVAPKLKSLLENMHSPLACHLKLLMQDVFKEYKNELKDIIASENILRSEIEFDIRFFQNASRFIPERGMDDDEEEDEDHEDRMSEPSTSTAANRHNPQLLRSVERCALLSRRISLGQTLQVNARRNVEPRVDSRKRADLLLKAFHGVSGSRTPSERNVSPISPIPLNIAACADLQPVVRLERIENESGMLRTTTERNISPISPIPPDIAARADLQPVVRLEQIQCPVPCDTPGSGGSIDEDPSHQEITADDCMEEGNPGTSGTSLNAAENCAEQSAVCGGDFPGSTSSNARKGPLVLLRRLDESILQSASGGMTVSTPVMRQVRLPACPDISSIQSSSRTGSARSSVASPCPSGSEEQI